MKKKVRDKVKKEDIYIAGDWAIIKSVTEKKIDDYLHIKRFATILKAEYDKENGFWEYMKPSLLDDINGSDIICLIYHRKSNKAIGYIELEMNEADHPKVGIGVLEEERKKGYAFETATLLINKAFDDEEIEYIE